MHALQIWDASQNAFFEASMLSSSVRNERAHYFIQFGVTRRLEMMWYAFRNLVSTAPCDRTEPLRLEESRQLMLDLNTIYLNIRGSLDNLAWALLCEFAPGELKSLRPSQVGFFLPCLKSNATFSDLHTLIEQHDAWDRDLKARRDPAAHGVPLALPPSLLIPEEVERYRELEGEWSAAIRRLDFGSAERISEAQQAIGRFHPWFLHEPSFGPIEIYPTVPDDIAHVVQIFGPVREYILRNKSELSSPES